MAKKSGLIVRVMKVSETETLVSKTVIPSESGRAEAVSNRVSCCTSCVSESSVYWERRPFYSSEQPVSTHSRAINDCIQHRRETMFKRSS
jgi:hypothetical protein